MFVDMSTFAYMWIDFVVIIPITLLIGNIKRKKNLTKNLPSDSIVAIESSLSFFFSLSLVVCSVILCMVVAPELQGYLTPKQIDQEAKDGASYAYF